MKLGHFLSKNHIKLIVLFIVVVAAYLLMLILRPLYFHEELAIIFGSNDMKNKSPNFYLQEENIIKGAVSPQLMKDNISYRQLYSTQANFVLKLIIFPPDLSRLNISLDFFGSDADLYVEIPCDECEKKLPVLPLYLKGLETYKTKIQVIQENPVFYYNRKEIHSNFEERDSIEEWINTNLSTGSPIFISRELLSGMDLNKIANTEMDYREIETYFNATFFPGQTFYIQSPAVLEIKLKKVNLNVKSGSDAFSIQVLDINDELITEKTFDDDGVKSGNKIETEQNLYFTLELPKEGVYQLRFDALENKDFEFSDLSLNTNKIIFREARLKNSESIFTSLNAPSNIYITAQQSSENNIRILDLNKPKEKIEIEVPNKYLGKGSEEEDVKKLQNALNKLGFFREGATGIYDSETINAVFEFQKSKNIVQKEVDAAAGYFGPGTHDALIAAIANIKEEKLPEKIIQMEKSVGTKSIPLPQGEYEIAYDNSFSLKNGYFALSKSAFFLPYVIELHVTGPQDSVLTRMDLYEDGGTMSSSNYFIQNELRNLEPKRDLKKLPLNLRLYLPPDLETIYRKFRANHIFITDFCGLSIYGIFGSTREQQEEIDCEKNNIANEIKKIIPYGERVDFATDKVNRDDFYKIAGIENYTEGDHAFDTNVRGNSEFAFYLRGDLDLSIYKSDFNKDVRDTIRVRIKNAENEVVHEDFIQEDRPGNNLIKKDIMISGLDGLYFLTFETVSPDQDDKGFGIEKININTNKFILLKGISFYKTTELFFNSTSNKEINFSFWRNQPQPILVDDDPTKTMEFQQNSSQNIYSSFFDAGVHKIKIDSGLTINNHNTAFSKDGYFELLAYLPGNDYLVADNFSKFDFVLYKLVTSY